MIGISERGKVETWSGLQHYEPFAGKAAQNSITCIYSTESRAMVPMKR